MNIVKEFEIIHPAQNFNEAPIVTREHMNCILKYDYEAEDGSYDWESICFEKAISYRFTTAFAASVDMISAYNAVGRILDSNWLKEIQKNIQGNDKEYQHYIVYFDEYGCYEFLSKKFNVLSK